MNFSLMFASLLTWLVSFLLYVPFTFLRLLSALLPSCTNFAITSFPQAVMTAMANWIWFYWPIAQYVPWAFVWNFLSAVILYFFFKWLLRNLPQFVHLVLSFWWIVVIFYVIAGAVNFFTDDDTWRSDAVFTEVFGQASTTTSQSGTGFGGGGGGSW